MADYNLIQLRRHKTHVVSLNVRHIHNASKTDNEFGGLFCL